MAAVICWPLEAGAQLQRMDHQETFVNGIPDPRDATNTRGLTVTNRNAMLISEEGNRFVDEALPSKDIEKAVFAQVQQKFWMVFDTDGAKKTRRAGCRLAQHQQCS